MSSSFPMRNMRVRFSGETNIGLKRAHNEDSFFLPEEAKLAIVADGMGGHASGEVASKMAVDTVAEHFRNTAEDAELTWPYKLDGPDKYDANRLTTGIKLANLRIYDKAQKDENCHGMGTTIVATLFLDDKVLIGHVGDSRVYRFRDGQLMQLTEDHSLLNDYIRMKRLAADDVGKFPHKNVIVRALGMKESVQVDLFERSDARQRHVPSVQRRALGHGRRPRARVHPAGGGRSRHRVRADDPRRQPQRRAGQHHLHPGAPRAAVAFIGDARPFGPLDD